MDNLGKARTAEVTAYFNSEVKSVWNIVTDNSSCRWRSDIERIEVSEDGNEFVEYAHNGNATKFIITKKIEFSQYEFKMENKMFTGFWTGSFSETEAGGTKIIFKENIFIKNPIIRFLSYFLMNLRKMQDTYIIDLKKDLGEQQCH